MKLLKKHLDNLFKECEHGDDEHRQWLRDKFNDYFEKNEQSFDEEAESEFTNKLINELPEYGIDTSKWEYEHGDCCYGGAVEFISRCIKSEGSTCG